MGRKFCRKSRKCFPVCFQKTSSIRSLKLEFGGKGKMYFNISVGPQMKSAGIVVTTAGQLKCENIIFVVAPDSVNGWEDVVYNCLKIAEGQGITSISFPALGTGRVFLVFFIIELLAIPQGDGLSETD